MTSRSRRIASLTLLSVLLVALTTALFVRYRPRPFDPRETPVGRVVGGGLGGHVVLVSRERLGAATEATVAAHRVEVGRRAEAVGIGAPMTALLAAMETAARGGSHDAFFAAGEALDGALTAQRLPYFVDTDVIAGSPIAYGYYVEREDTLEVAGQTERALHLFRIDGLGVRPAALGYTRPRASAALILLDQLEAELVVYVLPALAPKEATELLDERSVDPGSGWQAALRARAGEVVREAMPTRDGEPLREVGELLARRRALIVSWSRTMAGLGHRLRVPERLVPEADYSTELERRIARRELHEWDELHARLVTPRLLGAFLAARDLVGASVERHEVQHRLDYGSGLQPVPERLARLVGLDNPLDAPPGSLAARVRDEQSAFLAQIADSARPSLDVLLLARYAFDAAQWGTPYTYVSLAILGELAERTGRTPEPLIVRGSVDRVALAGLFHHLVALRPDALREAARGAWEAARGAKLPEVKTATSVTRERYRPTW